MLGQVSESMFTEWLVYSVTNDADFMAQYVDAVDESIFVGDPELAFLFLSAKDFWIKHGEVMPIEAYQVLVEGKDDIAKFSKVVAVQLYEDAPEPSSAMRKFVHDHARPWFQRRKLAAGLTNASALLTEGRVDDTRDFLVELTTSVAGIGLNEDLGSGVCDVDRFFKEFELEFIGGASGTGLAIPTGCKSVDLTLGGGLRKGELGVVMAGPGVGKSQWLAYCARKAWSLGHNVVYYTLEMDTERVIRRLLSGIPQIDMDTEEMPDDFDEFKKRTYDFMQKRIDLGYAGDVLVKRYPAKSVGVTELIAHLQSVARIHNWVPDLVVVDYADILAAKRTFESRRTDELAIIYEDLRGKLAQGLGIPVWTACQTNREGFMKRSQGLEHASDSWDKVKTADYVFPLAQTKQELGERKLRMMRSKVRNGSKGGEVDFDIDFTRSLFIDRGIVFDD